MKKIFTTFGFLALAGCTSTSTQLKEMYASENKLLRELSDKCMRQKLYGPEPTTASNGKTVLDPNDYCWEYGWTKDWFDQTNRSLMNALAESERQYELNTLHQDLSNINNSLLITSRP